MMFESSFWMVISVEAVISNEAKLLIDENIRLFDKTANPLLQSFVATI